MVQYNDGEKMMIKDLIGISQILETTTEIANKETLAYLEFSCGMFNLIDRSI